MSNTTAIGASEAEGANKVPASNHLSVLVEAVGYENMKKVKAALYSAGYVIYKGDPTASGRCTWCGSLKRCAAAECGYTNKPPRF